MTGHLKNMFSTLANSVRITDDGRHALQDLIGQRKVKEFVESNLDDAIVVFSGLARGNVADRDLLAEALSEAELICTFSFYKKLHEVAAWLERMNDRQRAKALSGHYAIRTFLEAGAADKLKKWAAGAVETFQNAGMAWKLKEWGIDTAAAPQKTNNFEMSEHRNCRF